MGGQLIVLDTFGHFFGYRNGVVEANFLPDLPMRVDEFAAHSGRPFNSASIRSHDLRRDPRSNYLYVIAHPRHELVHYAASTEPPARQVRMAAKALRPRSIPVSITEQTAA